MDTFLSILTILIALALIGSAIRIALGRRNAKKYNHRG